MPDLEEVYVNNDGIDANGDDYNYAANPKALAEGVMVNEPVMLVYPGGFQMKGTRVKITEKGLAMMAAQMNGGIRH